ncbi:MAG: hypothetical protein D3909_12380, partial [Candidatus Electrothrix sp. ATG1]|nr:hypothetical protein [Candidatus Electrothrix sp. ATG1]
MADGKNKKSKKKSDDPVKVKLLEGTAMKNMDKKEGKNRRAIWIKKDTLDYEVELKNLQVELMKLQKHMKATGMRVLAIICFCSFISST